MSLSLHPQADEDGERCWVNGFGFPAKTHYRNRNTSEADQKLASLRPSETVIEISTISDITPMG